MFHVVRIGNLSGVFIARNMVFSLLGTLNHIHILATWAM